MMAFAPTATHKSSALVQFSDVANDQGATPEPPDAALDVPKGREVVSTSVEACETRGCSRRFIANKFEGPGWGGRRRRFCATCMKVRNKKSCKVASAKRRKRAAAQRKEGRRCLDCPESLAGKGARVLLCEDCRAGRSGNYSGNGRGRECAHKNCGRDISYRHHSARYCVPCAKARLKLSEGVRAGGGFSFTEFVSASGTAGRSVAEAEVVDVAEWALHSLEPAPPLDLVRLQHSGEEDGEIAGYYPPKVVGGSVRWRSIGRKFCRGKAGDLF